jgi:hypothetical protein
MLLSGTFLRLIASPRIATLPARAECRQLVLETRSKMRCGVCDYHLRFTANFRTYGIPGEQRARMLKLDLNR